jgi:hypothetical protein
MPRPLIPSRTKARLAEVCARVLRDTCIIHDRQGGARNSYGHKEANYTPRAPQPCSWQSLSSSEIGLVQVGVIRAVCYLDPDTPVSNGDRLELTHRDGEALPTSLWFEVAGPPEPNVSTIAVQLVSLTIVPQPGG